MIGEKVWARCKRCDGYEGQLTPSKIYFGVITEGILDGADYLEFVDDNGKRTAAHLLRFDIFDIELSSSY